MQFENSFDAEPQERGGKTIKNKTIEKNPIYWTKIPLFCVSQYISTVGFDRNEWNENCIIFYATHKNELVQKFYQIGMCRMLTSNICNSLTLCSNF